MSLLDTLDRGVPPSRTQQTMVEQRAKELEDFRLTLRPEAELKRQTLRKETDELEREIEQLKQYLISSESIN